MLRNALFFVVLILLGVSFYFNRNFQLIAAGIAVLLFGMRFLEQGVESVASGTLYRFVKRVSNNFGLSLLLGILATTLLQSSSLTTVIAISFLSAGVLSLRSGLGIVLGANIGTTSTAWIVAYLGVKLNISALALPLLFFGILLQSRKVVFQKAIGNVLLGLGGFFMGVYLMQLGFADLQDDVFISALRDYPGWAMAISVVSGIVLTAILQSSGATMAIIISALAAGQITFPQALAMAIGANIGTTVTAILSSLNARIGGKQLAIGHLLFNLITALVALLMLPLFQKLIDKSAELLELSNEDLSLRLALFHTLFNVVGVLIFLPLLKPIQRLLLRIKPRKFSNEPKAKYLSPEVERIPQSAMLALYHESLDVLQQVVHQMNQVLIAVKSKSNLRFLAQLTTEESTPFSTYYYSRIKPILAEIQGCSARLSGSFNTQQFSIASRLIAEVARDFNHLLKDTDNRELMEQKAFFTTYRDLLNQIHITLEMLKAHFENGYDKSLDRLESRQTEFDVFNETIIEHINTHIRQTELSALAGTTLIHNADYTKRIIHKLIRTVKLLQEENYLEKEAEDAFRQ
jgi:phosphate:Na+ symporter